MFRYLKLVLDSLQAAKEILGLDEDGEKTRGISINHDTEDALLRLRTHTFELVWDRDESLHLPEIACSYLLKWRTELQTALPIHTKERRNKKAYFILQSTLSIRSE